MLTAAVLVALIGWAALVAAAAAYLVDDLDRRRRRRVTAQIRVTDAIHAALGAVVAPTVAHNRGQPWTVTIGLAPRNLAIAGRLTEIAQQALGREGQGLRIVFVPRRGD